MDGLNELYGIFQHPISGVIEFVDKYQYLTNYSLWNKSFTKPINDGMIFSEKEIDSLIKEKYTKLEDNSQKLGGSNMDDIRKLYENWRPTNNRLGQPAIALMPAPSPAVMPVKKFAFRK